MTLQALTYFVALAELGGFTKAAKQCFVTQPALSRAIAELEAELGRPLLLRNGRSFALTHAGRVLYEDGRRLLRQSEALIQRVQNDEDTSMGSIRLGYLFNGSLHFLSERLRHFGHLYPNVEVHTSYEHFKDAKRMLQTGELDLVLLGEATAAGLDEDAETTLVARGGLYVVVHKAHRLFARASVTFADIQDESFILWDPDELPGLYQKTLEAFRRANFEPKVAAYGKKLGDAIAYTTLKGGLGLTTLAAHESGDKVVRILPVTDCPTGFGIVLARQKNGTNPFAASFFAQNRALQT